MYTTTSLLDFCNAFDAIRPDNFSREGLRALFAYLTDFEESIGEEYELDVIGLCCEYHETEELFENKNYDEDLVVAKFLSEDDVDMVILREG